ncbi:MAG: DUF1553 domain-containing protein, partial [Planctomycetaceae bacterium]|nr:DUF1553 domain-containing protein [Planctomycetaceae bacterium]
PMPQRSQSTTALQALNLFNSPFVIERADVIAKRIEGQTAGNPADQVEQMFELVLGRPPEQTERSAAMDVIQQHGLSVLSRVLLNSNEFLFLP